MNLKNGDKFFSNGRREMLHVGHCRSNGIRNENNATDIGLEIRGTLKIFFYINFVFKNIIFTFKLLIDELFLRVFFTILIRKYLYRYIFKIHSRPFTNRLINLISNVSEEINRLIHWIINFRIVISRLFFSKHLN